MNTFSARPENDQKTLKKIEDPKIRKRRLDGLPSRFWIKIERIEHDARIHFAQKLREMP